MCIVSTYVQYWYTSDPIGSRDLAQTSASQDTTHRNSGNIFKYSFRGSVRIHEFEEFGISLFKFKLLLKENLAEQNAQNSSQ
jgi:hypothetical protein